MSDHDDRRARMSCCQTTKAGEHAILELVYAFSARRAAGLAFAIPALPSAIVLQRIERPPAPRAEIRLVEFGADFHRLAEPRSDHLGRLPGTGPGARFDARNAAICQRRGEALSLFDPCCT